MTKRESRLSAAATVMSRIQHYNGLPCGYFFTKDGRDGFRTAHVLCSCNYPTWTLTEVR